jgi:hypothetical protein
MILPFSKASATLLKLTGGGPKNKNHRVCHIPRVQIPNYYQAI